MGIATKNLVASGNESLRGARLSANCDQVGTQAAEEGDRFTATRASDTGARSSQCLDPVESRCGAVIVGLGCLLPPLSSGGAQVPAP
jgi:hypothetical protein